ncbi:MAG: N-acetyltransferase [Actinomycetota bacterium]|nr:N-acetyltransferase [Actinomycetota bacterium]
MEIVTLAERPDLEDAIWDLTTVWPRFMLEDPIANLYYGNLNAWFEHSLVALIDGTVAARAFSAAFSMDVPGREALPVDGWDGVVRWAHMDHLTERTATNASALEIVVAQDLHGTGIATRMVEAMIRNVDRLGFRELVAPVRPSLKHLEPRTPMRDYVARVRPDGLPEDPWMRIHARLGAETLSVCPTSMTIRGTIDEWAQWTGTAFERNGDADVAGALVPVHVDVDQDHAVYVEPNVWMRHRW